MTVMSSGPLITGIWTSVITHEVSFKWADCRNSSADANIRTVYPCDPQKIVRGGAHRCIIVMTDIIESVDKAGLSNADKEHLP